MKSKFILILYFYIFLLILFIFQLILIKYDSKKTYNHYSKGSGGKISDTLIINKSLTNLENFQIKDFKLLER